MTPLYAFWPLDPAARPADADLWGDPCPFDALACPDAGPLLTVVDEPTGALVFAADVSAMLRAYGRAAGHAAGGPAGRTDAPACPVRAALDAAHRVAAEAADEWAADALDLWQCPDPDTFRDYAPPPAVGRAIRDGAEAAGHAAAAADFLSHVRSLVAALVAPEPVAPVALVPVAAVPARRLAA